MANLRMTIHQSVMMDIRRSMIDAYWDTKPGAQMNSLCRTWLIVDQLYFTSIRDGNTNHSITQILCWVHEQANATQALPGSSHD